MILWIFLVFMKYLMQVYFSSIQGVSWSKSSDSISLDWTVFFFFFWKSVSSEVPHRTTLAKRYNSTPALILLMLRGPSPSIILYFQTEEGGSSKKTWRLWFFLYYKFHFLGISFVIKFWCLSLQVLVLLFWYKSDVFNHFSFWYAPEWLFVTIFRPIQYSKPTSSK